MKDINGVFVEWGAGLEETVTYYFSSLFKASDTSWEGVTNCLSNKNSEEQNMMLLAEKEVKAALFHMHPDKSPGPDGISPGFFQKCWNIIKRDIVDIVRRFC